MRVNVYAEELTNRVEMISKTIEGKEYFGIRFYLELPVTTNAYGECVRGPFMHHHGDDDSSAVTFWGPRNQLTDIFESAVNTLKVNRALQTLSEGLKGAR